jgi:hypothetical protein
MPIQQLGEADILQTWSVPEDEPIEWPYPDAHGTFDLQSFKQELFDGGKGVKLTFKVPDRKSEIRIHCYSTEYYGMWRAKKTKRRSYTFIIRPDIPWEQKVDGIPVEVAPGQ